MAAPGPAPGAIAGLAETGSHADAPLLRDLMNHPAGREYLVQTADVESDLSPTPLCQAMFIVEPPDSPMLVLHGLAIEEIEIDRGVAKFDLTSGPTAA